VILSGVSNQTQRVHTTDLRTYELSELKQRKKQNETTSLLDRQSQPPATTYMPLARCQAAVDLHEFIKINYHLHHELHNK